MGKLEVKAVRHAGNFQLSREDLKFPCDERMPLSVVARP
jgi:hypothetical protein